MRNNDVFSLRGRRHKRRNNDPNNVVEPKKDGEDELTDTGRQRALDDAVVNLQEAACVMKEVAQDVSAVHVTPKAQQPAETADEKILRHLMGCPAAKGYQQLRTVGIICTAVIASFIGLFLYLAPGAFENAISKGVDKAMSKREPSLKQYIDEQIIITQHQMWQTQMGKPPPTSAHNSNAPWRIP